MYLQNEFTNHIYLICVKTGFGIKYPTIVGMPLEPNRDNSACYKTNQPLKNQQKEKKNETNAEIITRIEIFFKNFTKKESRKNKKVNKAKWIG